MLTNESLNSMPCKTWLFLCQLIVPRLRSRTRENSTVFSASLQSLTWTTRKGVLAKKHDEGRRRLQRDLQLLDIIYKESGDSQWDAIKHEKLDRSEACFSIKLRKLRLTKGTHFSWLKFAVLLLHKRVDETFHISRWSPFCDPLLSPRLYSIEQTRNWKNTEPGESENADSVNERSWPFVISVNVGQLL